jgi:Tfp pilus assembly protein PilF
VSMYHRLLDGNSSDYELHFFLALAYGGQGNDELAELELEKAIAIKSDYFEPWQSLCFMALKNKDLQKALQCARRCVDANPKMSEAWGLMGYVCNYRKEYQQAIDPLVRAVRLDSANAGAYFELGSAYERIGRYDDAANTFRTVLRIKPGDAATANYLGYMWAERNVKLDSAQALIMNALRSDSQNGAYLDSYAWVLYMRGDYPKALINIRKALEKIDNDPIVFEHFGDIQSKMGDKSQAIAAYRKSIALGSQEQKRIEEKIRSLMESP